MYRTGITGQLAGFLLVVVLGVYVLQWAAAQLRPFLPVFVVLGVLYVGWRASLYFRRRW